MQQESTEADILIHICKGFSQEQRKNILSIPFSQHASRPMRLFLGQGTRTISLKSRAPLSPCCKPFDLQSQKEARITSGLMGLGWDRAQALEKDHSPAANPSISAWR